MVEGLGHGGRAVNSERINIRFNTCFAIEWNGYSWMVSILVQRVWMRCRVKWMQRTCCLVRVCASARAWMDDGVDPPRAQASCRELGRDETSKRQTPPCASATLGRIPREPSVLPTSVFDSVHRETSSTESMVWLKMGWNAQEGEKELGQFALGSRSTANVRIQRRCVLLDNPKRDSSVDGGETDGNRMDYRVHR